ncbi:TRAP transporter large permease subunit [uncultured Brachyspira sp.]|uniref:TRAP transporter large permease subunit n=1 Tax=uncultured Brachyspira sp. TaxID=221953 RepID=UPI0025D55563|nr:TRAP transporter large permease subunit [uncultured Brachyspira sp.]
MIGFIFIVFFIILLGFGFSMVLTYQFAFVLPMIFNNGAYNISDIVSWLVNAAGKTTYVAIALFVVSGNMMSKGKLTDKIFEFFQYFLGGFKSCIPVVAVLTAIFYGMISGSGVAVVAAVGSMVFPVLVEYKYDRAFFAAMLAAAGSLGQLIPPSSAILQYCAMANTSETDMFKVGAVIGFSCALALIIITLVHCKKDVGDQEKIKCGYKELKRKGFIKVFKDSIWGLLSPVIILGGIFTEYLSVVEAAAVSVVYAVFVSLFIYKSLDLKGIFMTFIDSVKNVASIAMMLAFAVAFTSLMDVFNGGEIISSQIKKVVTYPSVFIIGSIIIMSIGMMFMNPIGIIVPIVAPIALSFGIDPIVYGAGMAGIVAIGSLTPPFGVSLYIMAPISNVEPIKIAKTVFPLWLLMTIIISLYMFLPGLSQWAYK